MTVHSEVGRGATFTFAIPVQVVSAKEVTMASPCRRVIALEPGQPRYRILIVDDKPANRHLLVKLLRPLGFDVREAVNGQEAIAGWEDFAPHLIWMDMRMPLLDGYEATKRIRNEELRMKNEDMSELATRNTQLATRTVIIALTASSFEDEQVLAQTTGYDDVVRKPFREEEIFAIMYKHLGVRYVYEEDEGRKAQSERETFELTPADLAALPEEEYTQLQQAVNTANLRTMQRLIEQILEHNAPVADTLTTLVKQFRFDILQAALKE